MAKALTDIRSLARSHTAKALKVLAGIMNESEAPAAARVSAATALLDRGWGKPQQSMEMTVRRTVTELSDNEIAERIAELRGDGASDGDAAPPGNPSQLN